MVAITATNSATPSVQVALGKARLDQARREADRAEAKAQSLRDQADAAELDAQKSKENARELSTQKQPTEVTYTSPRNSVTSAVSKKIQDFLVDLYSDSQQKRASSNNTLKTNANSAPILNSQGQSTGRILNLQV